MLSYNYWMREEKMSGPKWVSFVRTDLTIAYVGTGKLFEDTGFTKAADTSAVSGGFPRVVMRLDLR